jgi:hypothetical protein
MEASGRRLKDFLHGDDIWIWGASLRRRRDRAAEGWFGQSAGTESDDIIDTKARDDVRAAWHPFIELHKYHYEMFTTFNECWIAKHPRRTAEAYFDQAIEAEFITDNSIPTDLGFADLWNWLEPLIEQERLSNALRPEWPLAHSRHTRG